jgi:hypothetical protein
MSILHRIICQENRETTEKAGFIINCRYCHPEKSTSIKKGRDDESMPHKFLPKVSGGGNPIIETSTFPPSGVIKQWE